MVIASTRILPCITRGFPRNQVVVVTTLEGRAPGACASRRPDRQLDTRAHPTESNRFRKAQHQLGRRDKLERPNTNDTTESKEESRSILLDTFFRPAARLIELEPAKEQQALQPPSPQLTKYEIEEAIMGMKAHKAPGLDGLAAIV